MKVVLVFVLLTCVLSTSIKERLQSAAADTSAELQEDKLKVDCTATGTVSEGSQLKLDCVVTAEGGSQQTAQEEVHETAPKEDPYAPKSLDECEFVCCSGGPCICC